jgi:hypothetical protein
MERRQAWMREFQIEQGQEPLAFVKSARRGAAPRAVAEQMRQRLGWRVGRLNVELD